MSTHKLGKLIIFSAPSGAGKTTLVHHLLNTRNDIDFSISCTTREKRPNEEHGKDYYFISVEEFKNHIALDAFAEWEEVYPNNFYGTLNKEIERVWEMGKTVVFDIDVKGGLNLKKKFGDQALAIFVQAPSIQELKNRLTSRNTESPEKLQMRIDKAEEEMQYAKDFDVIIVNDNLEKAKKETEQVVSDFLDC